MEHTTFFEHYRICDNQGGLPVSRTGPAINYKAIDTRSNEPVALQLIPIATIDETKLEQIEERARTAQKLDHVNIPKIFAVGVEHEYFGLVSEYLEGVTADAWIVAHGPMPADAVLRVGLQAVRAIAAAAFFGLTHRAIQPSNLMIVPGQSPDAGWPFVKVLNFGLAGIESHSDSGEARELAPSVAPQFASPEQLLGREIDFRSEMYSLGATMCFLLTGAVPLAVGGMKARLRLRRLPELHRAPRALRNLLVHMLRENPENRPQDPVAFETEMRQCLTKIERRQAIGRKLGIPLAAVTPRKARESTPLAQVCWGIVAFVVLLCVMGAAGAFFFPDRVPFLHRTVKVGVPVGVPDTSSPAPIAANQPIANPSPASPNSNQNPPPEINAPSPGATASAQIASANQRPEPEPPTEGPEQNSSPRQENVEGSTSVSRYATSESASSDSSNAQSKKKTPTTAPSRSTSSRPRITRALPYNEEAETTSPHRGSARAQVIGATPDGRKILRLPSGRVVFSRSRSDDEDTVAPRPRRRIYIERPDIYGPPPGYFPND
jgi:serine/threonine-protein kinase